MNNKGYKKIIIELHQKGLSYSEIEKETGCSKSLIAYHCNKTTKHKQKLNQRKRRKNNPLEGKYYKFIRRKTKKNNLKNSKHRLNKFLQNKITHFFTSKKDGYMSPTFSLQELKDKIGENPVCYLTGRKIDLLKSRTYELDHIIPTSRGGDNSLDNCGLACREANQAKSDLTPEEFLELCQDVVNYQKDT